MGLLHFLHYFFLCEFDSPFSFPCHNDFSISSQFGGWHSKTIHFKQSEVGLPAFQPSEIIPLQVSKRFAYIYFTTDFINI